MEKEYHFVPKGTCSRELIITYEDDVIVNLKVIGGCNGNLQGISALLVGMKFDDAISRLSGIKCGYKNTSCPDQIAMALKALKELKTEQAK